MFQAAGMLHAIMQQELQLQISNAAQCSCLLLCARSNAVIVATGASDFRDPFGPYNVDYQVGCSRLRQQGAAALHDA